VVKLYVEGGGDSATLKTACRQGFSQFITNAGIGQRPRVVACGSRRDAYDSCCTAIANGEDAVLLVDSEAPVAHQHQQGQDAEWQPWQHLKQRPGDGWDKPEGAPDTDCHLMVQCMESWLIADPSALKAFFGQGFRGNQLPATANSVESVGKTQVYSALAKATKACKTKAQYGKDEHSFKLLGKIDPTKVTAASPWASRFVSELKKKMEG
jgi:hypothetical protein